MPGNNKKLSKSKKKAALNKRANAEISARLWVLDASGQGDYEEQTCAMSTNLHEDGTSCSWREGPVVCDLHSHSTCSDGLLSPEALVARAVKNKVNILALTDHDTFAGVPAAMAAAAASSGNLRIIPGVEISATSGKDNSSVHILGYFGSCGPVGDGGPALLRSLERIRGGRFTRARSMVERLCALGRPVAWARVLEIAGPGVAPARPHIARALVEAGHVASEQEAFSRYIHDGGPVYSRGEEIPAAEAVRLIREAGGVSVLAHPWSVKECPPLVSRLAAAGLHGIESYQDTGKLGIYGSLADEHGLLKLGGSDFHGTGKHDERELGTVELPPRALQHFLAIGEPIWESALRQLLGRFARMPSANVQGSGRRDKALAVERETWLGAEVPSASIYMEGKVGENTFDRAMHEGARGFDSDVVGVNGCSDISVEIGCWPWMLGMSGRHLRFSSRLSQKEVSIAQTECETLGLGCRALCLGGAKCIVCSRRDALDELR